MGTISISALAEEIEAGREVVYRNREVEVSDDQRDTLRLLRLRSPVRLIDCGASRPFSLGDSLIHGMATETTNLSTVSKFTLISGSDCEAAAVTSADYQQLLRALFGGEQVVLHRAQLRTLDILGPISELRDAAGSLTLRRCEITGGTDISNVRFLNHVNLLGVEFRGGFVCDEVEFLPTVTVQGCTFQGVVNLRCRFRSILIAKGNEFQENAFIHSSFDEGAFLDGSKFRRVVSLSNSSVRGQFLFPSEYWNVPLRKRLWRRLRRRPSQCIVNATDVTGCENRLFRRWAEDTDDLRQFKDRHPVWYWIWLFLADCGRSFSLWLTWSVALAAGFGFAFRYAVRQFLVNGEQTAVSLFDAMYFSIITFTTLGLGDVLPVDWVGKVWVAAEVVVGYLKLGGLISIFADKLARRS